MSVQVSYKKQFTVMILLILVILVSIEGIARVYSEVMDVEDPRCNIVTNPVYENEDRELKQRLCSEFKKFRLIIDPIAEVATPVPNLHLSMININADGFRGPEISMEKPDGVYRVFVIGGSTTFGIRAFGDHQTIPGYLQEFFNQSNLERKIEVVNAGIPAATSTSESKLVEKKIILYEPDLIIFYDGSNDLFYEPNWMPKQEEISNKNKENVKTQNLPTLENNKNEQLKKQKVILEKNFVDDLTIWVDDNYKTAHVFNKINKDYEEFLKKFEKVDESEIKSKYKIDESLVDEKADIWKNNLSKICMLGKEKGFDTIVVLQPFLGTGNKKLTDHEKFVGYSFWNITKASNSYETFAIKLNELNDVCSKTMDLRNVFDDVEESVYFDQVHLPYKYNKVIAEKLFQLSLPIIKNE